MLHSHMWLVATVSDSVDSVGPLCHCKSLYPTVLLSKVAYYSAIALLYNRLLLRSPQNHTYTCTHAHTHRAHALLSTVRAVLKKLIVWLKNGCLTGCCS